MQVKTTVEPLHHGHHGDRRKRSLWRGGRDGEVGCNTTIFLGGSTTRLLSQVHAYCIL